MHRVVPELIIENYRAGHFQGEFDAIGMFLDLTGFSSMTDALMQHGQHGAEVLASLMHGVFDPLVENIFNHGGKIASFAGDGIMALFPMQQDNEQMVAHALASAWTIQQALLENPDRQTVYGTFHFSIRIGLALGSVSWGILVSTDGSRASYYFRGPGVDDSAKAEHGARAGEIVLTQEIYAHLRDEIITTQAGSYERLEGFRGPVLEPAPVVLPPIDVDVTKLFMPEEVITQTVAGEFRQIANLFIRIPDLSFDELQKFSQLMFELREKYGGLVNRVDFGDKGCNLLMLWGAPVAYENDISRALHFVLDLHEHAKIPVTAGVTYYVAHSGYLGSSMYEDYTCYGWGVNLASRFMMTAKDGEIWIDERVARRVKNRFEFEFFHAQSFKGFAEQQKVFRLNKRKVQEFIHQGEFVGREAELPWLIDRMNPLWLGKFAGVAAILGDAGTGKSRLVYELKKTLAHTGNNFLWALCHSDQVLRESLNPFRYWLFRYFEIDTTLDDNDQKQIFGSRLDQLIEIIQDIDLAAELDRLRSVLASLVDLHWDDSFYNQLDAEGRYNNTLNALVALIKAESLRQPVIFVVEDTHFLDEDSKAFLTRLKRALASGGREYPVLILLSTRRTGTATAFTREFSDEILELGALSTQALFDFAEIYLGGHAALDLVQFLEERSEGNPYFAEQILIYLKDENLLEMSRDGWTVTQRLQETSLPVDIRALLVARLDQLPRAVRNAIQIASVLGREFDSPILAEMLKADVNLVGEVDEAERANIWSATSPARYIFTHGLMRDAAYAMQTRARLMDLHQAALASLEKVYAEEVEHHYGELAHHAERARFTDKALFYLQRAGKAAADSYQNNAAVDYYTRALAFVNPDDLAAQYDLLVERMELYSRMGIRDLQLKDLSALERWAEELGDQDRIAKMLMLRASYYFVIGDYKTSIDFAEKAETYHILSPNSDLALYTQVVRATALLRLGRLDEAMQRALETLRRDQAIGNQKEEARILSLMGMIALEQKVSASAQKYLIQALEIARDIKDPVLENRVLNNLAVAEGSINGNYVLARRYYEESYSIAQKIGDRVSENNALGNIGFAAGMLGDLIAARSYREQALALSREIGNRYQETYTLIYLSAISGLQNEVQLALKYAQEAADLAQQISEKTGEGWAMLYLGHAYLLQSDFQMAETAYHKSIEIRNELNQPYLSMEPIAGLVETFLQANNVEAASREAEKILSFLESGSTLDGTDEPLRVYYVCYCLLQKKADPRSSLILDAANRMLEKQLSNISDEDSRRRFIANFPWRHALFIAGRKAEN